MPDELLELSVERRIDAPVDRVWTVMTTRMGEWFCPAPWRAEVRALDWHAGGRNVIAMHGPAGEAMVNEGIVLEVVPGRRFVVTDAFTHGWRPAAAFMVGIFAVEPDGEATRYRASARHWTREAFEQHRAMGFDAGWGAAADQLKALCERD